MRAHERQVNVRVRIDETREHVFARGIDHLRSRGRRDIGRDPGDRLALAEDVRDVTRIRRHDFSILDEKAHDV